MMLQVGPIIRFVCEDHPDMVGCECVSEMVDRHTSATALIDQLKELNLSLQIELRESQGDRDRLWHVLSGMLLDVNSQDSKARRDWFLGLLALYGIDPDSLGLDHD